MNTRDSRPLRRCVPRIRPLRRQSGFTLVEIGVAMTIALFLIGGILTIEQNNKTAYLNQSQLTQLQDAQRMAMTLITDVVQSAGYFPDPTSTTASSAFPVLGVSQFQQGQLLFGTHATADPGDKLYVRYQTNSGDGIILCNGTTNTTGAAQVYVNAFSVVSNGGTTQLVCSLGQGAFGTTQVPLVSGVQSLQVLYGVKRNAGTGNDVDTYLTADLMTNADWLAVTCIKVTLKFLNPLYGQQNQPQYISIERAIDLMNRTGVST